MSGRDVCKGLGCTRTLTQGLEMRPAGTEDEGSWVAWWGARGHVTRFGKINHYSYNVKNEGAG